MEEVTRWVHRLRPSAWSDLAVDVVLAIVLTVLAVLDVAADEVLEGERAPDAIAYGLVVAGGVALLWRRRNPVLVAVVIGIVMNLYWLRDHGAYLALLGLPSLYAVAIYGERRKRAWIAMGGLVVAMLVGAGFTILRAPEGFRYPNAVTMAAYLLATAATGLAVRDRRRAFERTTRRAARAEAERRRGAAEAVMEERSRIAREMHDVVAHGMSLIAVQASAAKEVVRTSPEQAEELVRRIETVSRESLTEMRRMLGALRSGDAEDLASLLPQPGLGDLAGIVEEARASGIEVNVSVGGDERRLAPGIELAVYRLLQESLTNVRKHAGEGAAASISIEFGPKSIAIEVLDDGAGRSSRSQAGGSGHGVIGMRERVEIYGGTFSAGPRPEGGWAVRARLPLADSDERVPSEGSSKVV